MRIITIVCLMLLGGSVAAPAHAQDSTSFLRGIQDYLAVSEKYVSLVKSKEAAVFMAVEGIVQLHEESGDQAKAVPMLKDVLKKYPDHQAIRNIVHFKLRDIYNETGRRELALEALRAVIEENR